MTTGTKKTLQGALSNGGIEICYSHTGDLVIASAQSSGGFVLHANRPNQPLRLAPHIDSRFIAVSPNGKLVATGGHGLKSVMIWEAETGKLVKSLPGIGWRINFSPDGKWLGTVADGYHLCEVGSWREGPKIGGGEEADSQSFTCGICG